jgi:hypothetical protein
MSKPYIVLRGDRAATEDLKAGDTIYYCTGSDYGLANDDTLMTGIQHVSMTRDPSGGYPFFTIPREDIARAKEAKHGADH